MNMKQVCKEDKFQHQMSKFLNAIHGENPFEIRIMSKDKYSTMRSILCTTDSIYKNNQSKKKTKIAEHTVSNLWDIVELEYLYSEGGEVFLTVNSPNIELMDSCFTSDKHIISGGIINSQFIDIDAPKEIKDNTLNLKRWKKQVKDKLLAFSLRPSIVVDTKNGYHVYWLLENGKHHLFRQIQMQLIHYFDGDKQCLNESRILRLPGFQHRKDPKHPYPVTLKIFEPDSRYSQEQLMNALPKLKEDTMNTILSSTIKSEPIEISDIKRGKVISLLLEKINYTKQYGGKISMHCCMPEHEDRHPSAWIDTDYMWFHCSGCGTHLKITELAELLGWKEVLEEWNKYNIDLVSELEKIREKMINVNELDHLILSFEEQSQVKSISLKVIEKLISYGQNPNVKHRQNIQDIMQILLKSNKDKPYLIPLIMGGGKSLIIETFLQEIIKMKKDFGAVVAVERITDVKALSQKLNKHVGKEVAYPLYGFEKTECLLNRNKGKEYETCPASKGMSCLFKKECRYWNQGSEQEKFPVVIMTTKRLSLQHEDIETFNHFNKKETDDVIKVNRDFLIIDEKPKLTNVTTLKVNDFNIFTDSILKYLESYDINGNIELYEEFKIAVERVASLYKQDLSGRKIIEPLNVNFSFSEEFWKAFKHKYDYINYAYDIPKTLESIIKNGGHMEKKGEENISITTSFPISYSKFSKYKTVIFDGTANIDIEYQYDKYHLIDFEPIRNFENLTFFISSLVNGSKISMQKDYKIEAFCEDIKKIANENFTERIYVPVFKDNKKEVEDYLQSYIESGQIKVAHYGSTKGSNAYKECSIIVLGGILHKTEDYYIGKTLAIDEAKSKDILDINGNKYGKIRRFNDFNIEKVKLLDMVVDYTQEIMRSSQRDNSRNVNGKVYIFHQDEILLATLQSMFPASKVEKWIPQHIIEMSITQKKNNKNVTAICEFIKKNIKNEIYFSDIQKEVSLSKQSFSNTLKNPFLLAFLEANHYVEKKVGRNKFFVKIE